MPANLTPAYLKAEQEYRRAQTLEEELKWLQVMLQEMPKHKGTDHLQAMIKAKIAKVKREIQEEKKGKGKKSRGIRIPRQGAGTAIILGGPNAGKSQLLASLTRAQPEIAPYPFTTKVPMPGMMPWEDVFVQLIDTPPITAEYIDPNTIGLIRSADLALLVVDLGCDEGIEQCQEVLDRLNNPNSKTRLATTQYLDEQDLGISYTRTFLVPNKIDLPDAQERLQLLHELVPMDFPEYVISAKERIGLDRLAEAIFKALDVVRVYTKLPSAKEPDLDRPFTLRRGQTVLDLAEMIHNDYVQKFKFARVWGTSVYPGTQVKGDYVLQDKDIVEIHI
ncbi:MAG: TGS domain-containing protein [Thermoguttaceae bacterium]|nr:TGS domain-containing protein [Thermoguttaceae bacterium]MDW8038369.1 TGS domain-containing protein [Thermoguttaceae bacterium]